MISTASHPTRSYPAIVRRKPLSSPSGLSSNHALPFRHRSRRDPSGPLSPAILVLRTLLFNSRFAFALQCVIGILLTLLLGAGGVALKLNLSTASLIYLLLTVSFAMHCGFWQASVISFSAIGCLTYFFAPPAYTFFISDPRNAVAIIIFEAAALIVSRVSASERAYALESERQKRKTQKLYAVSHNALLLNLQDMAEQQMSEFILQEFELDAVAVMDNLFGTLGAAGVWAPVTPATEAMLRAVDLAGRDKGDISHRALVNADGKVGCLIIKGDISPLVLESLASLVLLALERHRAFVNVGLAEAARKAEQLRTTVLDGLAHAFKTPLTVIRAASSGLLEASSLNEAETQLTRMIDEQSIKLEELTTRMLQTARVEGESMCLELEYIEVPQLIAEVVRQFRAEWPEGISGFGECPTIAVTVMGETSQTVADHEVIASTLKELLKNAHKYSNPGSPISVAARESEHELTLSVQSYGPVIHMDDRELIFERFYRGQQHQHTVPGTGIGLSVARRVTEAHGGHIWLTSSETDGTTFYLSLPRRTPAIQ